MSETSKSDVTNLPGIDQRNRVFMDGSSRLLWRSMMRVMTFWLVAQNPVWRDMRMSSRLGHLIATTCDFDEVSRMILRGMWTCTYTVRHRVVIRVHATEDGVSSIEGLERAVVVLSTKKLEGANCLLLNPDRRGTRRSNVVWVLDGAGRRGGDPRLLGSNRSTRWGGILHHGLLSLINSSDGIQNRRVLLGWARLKVRGWTNGSAIGLHLGGRSVHRVGDSELRRIRDVRSNATVARLRLRHKCTCLDWRRNGSLLAVIETKRLGKSAEARDHEARRLRSEWTTLDVNATGDTSEKADRVDGITLASVVGNTSESRQRVARISAMERGGRASEAGALSEKVVWLFANDAYPVMLRETPGPELVAMIDKGMLAILLGWTWSLETSGSSELNKALTASLPKLARARGCWDGRCRDDSCSTRLRL
jgi:hypothetical protein